MRHEPLMNVDNRHTVITDVRDGCADLLAMEEKQRVARLVQSLGADVHHPTGVRRVAVPSYSRLARQTVFGEALELAHARHATCDIHGRACDTNIECTPARPRRSQRR